MRTSDFHKNILRIDDIEALVDQITAKLKKDVIQHLRRYGGAIGLSGGIDSSVTMALAARSLGPENVVGIMMPEKDSSPESMELAIQLAKQFNVRTIKEEITGALEGYQCYQRRDQAVKEIIPEYDPQIHKMKIGIKQSKLQSKLPH